MKPPTRRWLWIVAVILLAAENAPYALGQQVGLECEREAGRRRPTCEERARESQSLMRWGEVEGLRGGRRESRLPLAQIREDFARLQAVNGYLARAASRGGEMDFKAVAKSASEVEKLARRLGDNLMLPRPEVGAVRGQLESQAEEVRLRPALTALVARIQGVARNPIFKGYVFDAALSAEAQRDIDEIVELSGRIKRSSEQSSKGVRLARASGG